MDVDGPLLVPKEMSTVEASAVAKLTAIVARINKVFFILFMRKGLKNI